MRTRWIAVIAILFGFVVLVAAARSAPLIADTASTTGEILEVFHLALDRSVPEADATTTDVTKISLWFTQAPQMAGTSVRVVPAGGEPLDLGKAKANPEDASLIELSFATALEAGKYTVHWRAMAQDGHTVRGDFEFTVRSGR